MRYVSALLFCFIYTVNSVAQEIQLSLPLLPAQQVKLYYYTSANVDSLFSATDASGKARIKMPQDNYRGMAIVAVPGAGGIEFVVAEPYILLECNTNVLDNETVRFPGSEENRFIKYVFTNQSLYVQQKAWLDAGSELFPGSSLLQQIQPELEKVNSSMAALDKEITSSQLYAARYFRLSDFMNRLFDTEQQRDVNGAMLIRKEMETNLDIASLYHSGQLWNSVLNFYLSLFNHTAGENKQQQYASSILRTIERLTAPYYEAYLAGCIVETERFGWQEAKDSILSQILVKHPGFTSSFAPLQRALGAYLVKNGQAMPAIAGLNNTNKSGNRMLLAFYDSDCSSCANEMFRLITIYPQLEQKGIRVVSIAADTDNKRYKEGIKDFPWADRLCDFEGFRGANFSNYNIVGSPSFYLMTNDRKLQGCFFSTADLEKFLNEEGK